LRGAVGDPVHQVQSRLRHRVCWQGSDNRRVTGRAAGSIPRQSSRATSRFAWPDRACGHLHRVPDRAGHARHSPDPRCRISTAIAGCRFACGCSPGIEHVPSASDCAAARPDACLGVRAGVVVGSPLPRRCVQPREDALSVWSLRQDSTRPGSSGFGTLPAVRLSISDTAGCSPGPAPRPPLHTPAKHLSFAPPRGACGAIRRLRCASGPVEPEPDHTGGGKVRE